MRNLLRAKKQFAKSSMKSREHIPYSRAAFYACMWNDFRQAAINVGWALGLHGSLNSDMDIMAMAWDENSADLKGLIDALKECFTDPESIEVRIDDTTKPNNRTVITMGIFADFYLDINVIRGNYT